MKEEKNNEKERDIEREYLMREVRFNCLPGIMSASRILEMLDDVDIIIRVMQLRSGKGGERRQVT